MRASLLVLCLVAAPLTAAGLALADDDPPRHCHVGALYVLDKQVAEGWVLCCQGADENPLKWWGCGYGGWHPVVPSLWPLELPPDLLPPLVVPP